ncbi:hypothetical protein AVEN_199323-1 [Araneus ventricosus]|uniref:Helitron helicase-like domain-containing protein n=1 Tax=Araneus ventricosus TaxID=182803 RepID=A0A4Y2HAB2_ARAVE|nr:hypothetical protein AVEN_199323-1 [Araneus ventricosus]
MPKRKRNSISQIKTKAKKIKLSRANETHVQRQKRLQAMRDRDKTSRAGESKDQRQQRLQVKRIQASASRATELEDQREHRLQKMREQASTSRATESEDQREHRLQTKRIDTSTSRVSERHSNLCLEGFHYDPRKDYSKHINVIIGGMNQICKYCFALKYKCEPPGMCCCSGKVRLPALETPPEPLLSYMSGTTSESKHFLKNIRRYNSCFQMTSFGASSIVGRSGFETTFKIQGQIYHKAGSLLPLPSENAKFLQTYFIVDEEREVNQRCDNISGVRRDIVLNLQRMFHENNQLIKTFKTALEDMPSDECKVVICADRRPVGEHERRFNNPQINEVAIIIAGSDCDRRDIVIQKRGGSLQRISETNRSYDALQYPIIFWQGEDGYNFDVMQCIPNSESTSTKKVSMMNFYAYRIMIRNNSFNHILNARQLFHQFIVDVYAKIEAERLLYIRLNQNKLRSEEYIHLKDAVATEKNVDDIGKMVILPSTFTGSPRQMHEYAQDAMTYVRSYGRPDLFITFTCNSAWPEIKEELSHGQTATDRHDLLARVFRQKQQKFINVLTKMDVFGEARCWMYSIEWQKRGLPHSHNLIWLKEKIHSTQIDDVISAEFPNPEVDPVLSDIVKKSMIHGPCGNFNMNSPCMKDGRCSKKYSRQLLKETQTGEDGYPKYRRRSPEDGGCTAKISFRGKEIEIDNKWVVPYSPLLSKMFHAHINVEYCKSVKSIKYICKYIHKGSDMAIFGLKKANEYDEVSNYQLGRYISSNEAVWRVLSFPIHERHPTVVHLSVHLENGQRVYFTRENAQAVASEPPRTTLTAFFQLCKQDPFARTLLYPEVPRYYTWDSGRKVFVRRKKGTPVFGSDVVASEALGRVYTVHPNNSECFFLRMLLHTIKGPNSYAMLKTVDGRVCNTFREACQKLGLLEDDEHWTKTMSEAMLTSSPDQIRNLFAIILTTCNPSNPRFLWDKFRESMSEDFLARVRRNNVTYDIQFSSEIFNNVLIILESKCMSICSKTLSQLGLQSPERNLDITNNADLLREKNYNTAELGKFVESNKPLLTDDQRKAYDYIMECINNEKGGYHFPRRSRRNW